MKISGIYKIESKIRPDRIYIGSAISIKKRWNYHKEDLKRGKHHSIKLQRHFDKYGESDFIYSIIEPCFPEFLSIREQYYLDLFSPYFNICKNAYTPLGLIRSLETRLKISKNHADVSGKNNPMYGKPQSAEHRMKVKLNHADISGNKNPMFGKHHTEETKEKIRVKLYERRRKRHEAKDW